MLGDLLVEVGAATHQRPSDVAGDVHAGEALEGLAPHAFEVGERGGAVSFSAHGLEKLRVLVQDLLEAVVGLLHGAHAGVAAVTRRVGLEGARGGGCRRRC